jgi:uncharacterized protein YeaO (DUF488 family)
MPIAVVRLGSPRLPDEGVRIGTVRRPPRGVPKASYAQLDYYDTWLPNIAPSQGLMAMGKQATDVQLWKQFERTFRREMAKPEPASILNLLAALSHQTNLSIGCYCANENRCHRSILRALLAERGAELVQFQPSA